jgi:hypothetical protein
LTAINLIVLKKINPKSIKLYIMIKKLRNHFKLENNSSYRRSGLLAPFLIIILYLGGMSNIHAINVNISNGIEESKIILEDLTDYPKIIKSYNITDSSTEDKSCFPTKGKGVIFQRAEGCEGFHHIWRVNNDLIFNEYDNGTATIFGSVIDVQGSIGLVNIALYNKSDKGNTWNAECYLGGISDARSLYRSFNGTINVNGESFSVEVKKSQQHFILADGAGFESGQYGFGAWTGGSFGECTEWFGNLDPIDIDCKITVDAGKDQSNCNIEGIVLTANAANASDCSTVISTYKIIDSNTEAGCFTANPGVIFQKYDDCSGVEYTWSAGDDLELNEFDNDTAAITGTVTDQNGRVAIVDIKLTDKENTGTTWSASCYLDGISGSETYYRSFYGTITADGVPVTVGTRFNAHYILANGAGFDSNQFGLGAWTGGAFGECTEWFGNLVPQTIDNASNGVSYVWSTADGNILSDSNQETITVNKAGTYKVTAKDCKDCEAFDTVVITEISGPTVNAGEDVEVCNDELVELTAIAEDISECTGGCVYPIERISRCDNASNISDVWLENITNSDRGFVTSSSEFKTFDDGTATYTAIATNGIDNIDVNIMFSGYTNKAPKESPKENTCDSYDTSDWVYWTNTSGTIVTEQHGTLTVSRAGPSMQLGEGADVSRNGFGASGWLTISGGDGFYTAGDINIKLGDCTTLDTGSVEDYLWSTTDGNIVGDANQKTITVDKSGTYTVSVSDCESCAGNDSVIVKIVTPKAYMLEGAANFCIDGDVDYLTDTMVSVSGDAVGTNNTFVVTDAEGKILGLPATFLAVNEIDFDASGEGTCLLWNLSFEDGLQGAAIGSNAKDLEGCFDLSASIKIIRNAAPVVNAGDDVSICKDEEVVLTAIGGGSYLWSTGDTTASIKVTPTQDTTYTVTVTSTEGCEATDEVKVSLNPEVIADAGDDVSICKDEEVALTATGGGFYLWSTGETTASIKVTPTQDTAYTVTVTSTEGCEATDEVKVSLNPEVTVDAGDDVSICKDEEVALTATGGGSYLWSTGETTATIKVNPTQDTTYTVTVTSTEGCEATDEVKVSLNPEVIADAGDDVSICKDEEVTLTATGGGSYLWSTGETTASIKVNPTQDTTYTVTVTSTEGCEANDEVKVSLNPEITVDAGDDVSICKDEEVALTATGGGSYLWSTGETTASIKVTPTQDTTYTITVTSAEGCEASDEVKVSLNPEVIADAGADITVCLGDETMLTATGGGSYLWSTGETTASISVEPRFDTVYSVTVTSEEGCEESDNVFVTIIDKVIIGDFVWLDDNRNGLQDDGATGVNDVKVTLYHCDGEEVASTMTANNSAGESGAYSFEVCSNSGEYYVIFGDVPEGTEFTSSNAGTNDDKDSDANTNGRTDCFEITDIDDLTIDGGLIKLCNIKIDAGNDVEICDYETIEITANIVDNTADCPSVCVYPIKDQERCYGPEGNYEVYLVSTGHVDNFKFKASEQKFVRYADNTARYTATASNGKDVIKIDALYTGYTVDVPVGSPKNNACQQYDTSDWQYWTTWSGTITSENHGVFNLSVKAAAFQMGDGADVTRTGFGASGWFYVDGGDGFYSEGDVNVTVDPCVENGVSFKWTTENGSIVGDANQKTIKVNAPGTYIVEAVNCLDCFTTDTITVTRGLCNASSKRATTPVMSAVYPVPVQSGGTLTLEFDIAKTADENTELNAISLKATVDFPERQEEVTVMLYDMTGRVINIPKTFKIVNGKAVVYIDLDFIPSGKYILRAQGPNWSDAKNVLVK